MNIAVDSFAVSGIPIDPTTPINLDANWNWIAYYPQSSFLLEDALTSIEDNVYQIKNQTQSSIYDPVYGWIGDLTQMEPGVGYKICMIAPDILIYPGEGSYVLKENENSENKVISGTQYNMVLMAQLIVDNELIRGNNENEIIAYGPGGETDCRAIGIWLEDPELWYLTIVGNENGEEISFKIYKDDKVYKCFEKIIFEDNAIIGTPHSPYLFKNTIEFVEATKLKPNFPNPFTNSTTISFSLREQSLVKLSIYNIKGELVKILVDEKKVVGSYSETWDGKDDNNNPINTGIYFYRLEVGNRVIDTKNCLILK